MSIVLVFSTLPDAETAQQLAKTLVEEGLVACVNILPGIQSVYRWQGVIETSAEVLLMAKTASANYPALEVRLKALHPYELPEIVAFSATMGLAAYFDWVNQSTLPCTDKEQ